MKHLSRYWPLIAALLIYWATVGVLLFLSLRLTGGQVICATDDAYIHMAIAKNFVEHGVWGVTRYGFTAANSSVLWPLLLSVCFWLTGIHVATPLVLNILSATLALVVAYFILRHFISSPLYIFAALEALFLLTPLPTLTFAGLEHSLQTAVTLLTAFVLARQIADDAPARRWNLAALLAVAAAVTAVRFEGAFLIAGACGLFLLRKRWLDALGAAASGFLPIAGFGLVSVAHGWHWLPNTLLLKGRIPDLRTPVSAAVSIISYFEDNIESAPHLFALILLVTALYLLALQKGKGPWEMRQVVSVLFVVAATLHMEFGRTGAFFRYESYLVGLGLVVTALQVADYLPHDWRAWWGFRTQPQFFAALFLAALVALPLCLRGFWALIFVPRATFNIYEQQIQMGRFIKEYYQGSSVALNDIGAVDYIADVHLLDMWGLANLQVAAQRRNGEYHAPEMAEFARQAGTRVAFVYDIWFEGLGGVPSSWARVGKWTIRGNVVAGSATVSIYAVAPAEAPRLIQHLRDFYPQLPPDVIQTGDYMEWPATAGEQ